MQKPFATSPVTDKVQGIGNMQQQNRNKLQSRAGLSLLEVILSIAILGVSMVAIGHLFNLGFQSATDVNLRSEANMIADTTMAEVAAGVIDLGSSGGSVESNPRWKYEVNSESSSQPGLMSVTVRVSLEDESANNISISLVRMMVDPDFEPSPDSQGVLGSPSSSASLSSGTSSSFGSGSR